METAIVRTRLVAAFVPAPAVGGSTVGTAIAGSAALGAGIGAAAGLVERYLWSRHRQAEPCAFERGVAAGRVEN